MWWRCLSWLARGRARGRCALRVHLGSPVAVAWSWVRFLLDILAMNGDISISQWSSAVGERSQWRRRKEWSRPQVTHHEARPSDRRLRNRITCGGALRGMTGPMNPSHTQVRLRIRRVSDATRLSGSGECRGATQAEHQQEAVGSLSLEYMVMKRKGYYSWCTSTYV